MKIVVKSASFFPSEVTLYIPKPLFTIAKLPRVWLTDLFDQFEEDESSGASNNNKLMEFMINKSENLFEFLQQRYSFGLQNKVSDFLSYISGMCMKIDFEIIEETPNKPTVLKLICPHYKDAEHTIFLTSYQIARRRETLRTQAK